MDIRFPEFLSNQAVNWGEGHEYKRQPQHTAASSTRSSWLLGRVIRTVAPQLQREGLYRTCAALTTIRAAVHSRSRSTAELTRATMEETALFVWNGFE